MSAPALEPAACGERIELLLQASAAAGPAARERAEELVRLVVDLYGAGLERVLELAYDAGALDDRLLEAFAGDELVASLLLVHGLHPYSLQERIERALDGVRPYLGSHGGNVRLIEATDDGVVHLQLLGTCDGCASSSVTLELAVDSAIRAAAPEVVSIELEEAAPKESGGVIPVDQLTVRLRMGDHAVGATWITAAAARDIPVGGLIRVVVGDHAVLLCRLTSGAYAYLDSCARCGSPFEGAALQRAPSRPGSGVLTCHSCNAHFDVRHAGVDLEDPTRHLEPVPLLERDGDLDVAVRTAVPA